MLMFTLCLFTFPSLNQPINAYAQTKSDAEVESYQEATLGKAEKKEIVHMQPIAKPHSVSWDHFLDYDRKATVKELKCFLGLVSVPITLSYGVTLGQVGKLLGFEIVRSCVL